MKKVFIFLPLLLVWGCSEGESPEYPEVESRAEQYLQAQASGNWQALCQQLAPSERSSIQRALGKPCLAALQENKKLAARLRQTSTRIKSVTEDAENYKVVFESGEIWITPSGVTFTEP